MLDSIATKKRGKFLTGSSLGGLRKAGEKEKGGGRGRDNYHSVTCRSVGESFIRKESKEGWEEKEENKSIIAFEA